jgi:hypothetical protein
MESAAETSGDQTEAAQEEEHGPSIHPAKAKSGAGRWIWIILVLLVAGGAAFFLLGPGKAID